MPAYRRANRQNEWWVDATLKSPGRRDRRVRMRSPVQTKKGAEEYERKLLENALASGASSASTAPTLREFAVEFLTTYAKANNKLSEVESKESILRVHLLPALGALTLDAIDARAIEGYKARKLAGEGERALSPKTINNHLTVLRKLLTTARAWGLVREVPQVAWTRPPPPEVVFLTFDEADRLVAAADPDLWATMILTAIRTGLRLGELLALRWVDVDLERGKLVVRRSRTRGKVGTPKNGRSREVPLAESVRLALRARAAGQPAGELVFGHQDGSPYDRGQTKWALYRACAGAGLPACGWHVLRHTFASHLAIRSVRLQAIQELLGHSDLKMTMRYAHLLPAVHQDAVALLDGPSPLGRGTGT